MESHPCPLCGSHEVEYFAEASHRHFLVCTRCALVFAEPAGLPDPDTEKNRYQQHQNSKADEGYVKFLKQPLDPALELISRESLVLDYGCGPEPVLSQLLQEKGVHCQNFDPFFYPKEPEGKFDCIFSTETFEHFHYPHKELQRISSLLNDNGLLVIMTEFYKDASHFRNWWYTRDFTHVVFYNQSTFEYICSLYGFAIQYTDGKRVVILRKSKA